ncbi:MAG: hypothetical protein HGA45_29000 [Chloroflexales bacterium]|nr:hypothetical protein [Chloroflexales bacterium]
MSSDFERLVGRAILDPVFRKQLLNDPDGTVKGLSITAKELQTIRDAANNRGVTDTQLDSIGLSSSWK